MHPRLQISIAWSYCFSTEITSGALYHLVPMWLLMALFFFYLVLFYPINFFEMTSHSSFWSYCWLSFDLRILSLSLFEFPEPLPTQLSDMDLDSPKSQILMLQSSSTRMFEVLMSLCIMFAEWRNLRAQTMLYRINEICPSVRET